MTQPAAPHAPARNLRILLLAGCLAVGAVVIALWPTFMFSGLLFSVQGLIDVAPLVIPGILITAWIMSSGADRLIRSAFQGRVLTSVIAASALGAVTPVCGVTVLPLMAGLLAAGVPFAPVMAFWLSSPITDPAMLATTAATLGIAFAVGKTVAAFGLGLFGGALTAVWGPSGGGQAVLRPNRLTMDLSAPSCCGPASFNPRIWEHAGRRASFMRQAAATTKLILICLGPAFFAEYALNAALTPGSLAHYVGPDKWWAIPAAVFVGAPAYIDGYAALPLTRGLLDNGMSQGAAMAFLVSGGTVSIWGALAIFPVLKLRPFGLYLALAVTGSLLAGYAFDWIV
ncbi:hypothetical protein JM93_01955 [Roseibium hamelinense]|uniref:Permease n=1 Tax=Roseibium hamelinense TaxID=150831 RepID=A0A562T3G0_9HYPH|nr:permease [Roseibium hamelinense]MTI44424.1 permease [Roseibium hamelinense]TWI87390.1 hypothetical protein JM93_01955 [Roseibium hamelinense]